LRSLRPEIWRVMPKPPLPTPKVLETKPELTAVKQNMQTKATQVNETSTEARLAPDLD
jgi:hypothetical protein